MIGKIIRDLDIDGVDANFSNDFAYHVEAFYKYRLNDNISVTPGLIWLPSVNQNADSEDVFVGTVRTTFRF